MNPNLFTQSLAEITVTYSHKVRAKDRIKIDSSSKAAEVLRLIWSNTIELNEEFYILLLNNANQVLGFRRISQGGISSTVVDLRLIFSVALKCNASALILAHNHPSGNTNPSEADIALTKKIGEGGKLLDIKILDHIIMTSESYYSFADEGRIV